jgi:predicted MFS family arabinose efflux permease
MPTAECMTERADDPTRLTRREWGLLLVLAAMQFTHILDFVIMMPLGPEFAETLSVTTRQFGWMVSVYGFSACVTGLFASTFLDRYDRKTALLGLYAGFTVGTVLCGAASSYLTLVLARAVAGGFAGVMAATVLAVVGDVFPDVRRGTAMGVVMSAFSVAAVLGVPVGLYFANHTSWRAPFLALGALSVAVGVLAWRVLPPIRHHLAEAGLRPGMWEIMTDPRHLRAYALTTVLVMGSFTLGPYISLYLVNNVGLDKQDLEYVLLFGGAATLLATPYSGKLSDRYGKLRVFRLVVLVTLVPTLLLTNLPRTSVSVAVLVVSFYMSTMSARMVPAMALITASARARYRGSFMSINSSVQQLGMGLAPLLAALFLNDTEGREPLVGFSEVGLLSALVMLSSVYFAGHLRSAEAVEEPVPA